MNIAPKIIQAVPSAGVRSSVAAVIVSGFLLGLCHGALAAPPEQGGQGQSQSRERDNNQRFDNNRASEQRQVDPRSFEGRAEEQRRVMQLQNQNQNRSELTQRSGRLTADERRDLRRQINEAGQDIYANPPRR